MRYLCNKYDLNQFYPADDVLRARTEVAMDWRQVGSSAALLVSPWWVTGGRCRPSGTPR